MFSCTIAPSGHAADDELAPAHDLARPRGERRQQAELGRRQRRGALADADAVGGGIEPQAAGAGRAVLAPALEQRADAHEQLGQRERLGQVVVAAGVEAGQPVGQLRRAR